MSAVTSPPTIVRRIGRRWLNAFRFRNLCALAGLLGLVYVAATASSYSHILSADPTVEGGSVIGGDFAAFYAAGRLVLQGETRHIYDAAPVRAIQQAAIQGQGPDFYVAYRNPPFLAVVQAPITLLPLIPSFAAWMLLSIALLILAVALIVKYVPWVRTHWKLVVLGAAGFFPVYSGLVDGQNAALSLLLYVLVYRALREGHNGRAGLWAAAGLFKPQLFFTLPIVFAASRRWRALLVYSAVATALALTSLLLVGVDGATAWARIIFDFEPGNAAKLAGRMYSLKAFFDVLLPEEPRFALGLSLLGSLVVLGLIVRIWRDPAAFQHNVSLRWVFTMLAALLVDPHLLDYDLTVLVLPALLMLCELPDAPWWIAGMFLITLIDTPLTVGVVHLQTGVILLAMLAVRVWWHLECGRQQRLPVHPSGLVEISYYGELSAA
jgi:hypothetical protein